MARLTMAEVRRVVSDDTYGSKATELAQAFIESQHALKDVEWVDDGDGGCFCPCCGESGHHGHDAICKLAMALLQEGDDE